MLAMRRLGPAALAFAVVLIAPGRASAEIVARGVHDGSLALDRKGTPYVAYSARQEPDRVHAWVGPGRWRAQVADSVSNGLPGHGLPGRHGRPGRARGERRQPAAEPRQEGAAGVAVDPA